MHIHDLTFTDGKRCRCVVMEPEGELIDQAGIRSIFLDGYVASVERIIKPPPDKLPWRRDGQVWRIGQFELTRLDAGIFRVTWPGGSAEGGKDEVSAAVRENWRLGC